MNLITIEEAFAKYRRTILQISSRYSRSSGVPREDFESDLTEELWMAHRDYDPLKSSFDTWINTRLRRRATRTIKSSNGTFYRRVSAASGQAKPGQDDDESTPMLESLASEELIEKQVHQKKKADKRQLIDFLLEPSTVLMDPVMAATKDGIESGVKVSAIAKSLGLHPMTLDRKVRALSRRYNPEVHGDIVDYLPDGFRVKREYITA